MPALSTLRLAVPLFALALPVSAQDLTMPFPVRAVIAEDAEFDSYSLPTGAWRPEGLPHRVVEGQVDRRAWHLDAPGASLLSVLAPLRDQLLAAGFQVELDCAARDCGGFDFRFATEVLPEPAMHVDLGEYRFLAASRGADQAIGLLVSRTADLAFVQEIRVGPEALAPPDPAGTAVTPSPRIPSTAAETALPEDLDGRLDAGMAVALDDLVFASGSATLTAGDYASLAALAAWLQEDPARSLVLVGHTDVSGGLQANVALSKKRAEAVRQALISGHGIAARRLGAEGIGPLSPRADNVTEEGRARNRRVEAIPAPT